MGIFAKAFDVYRVSNVTLPVTLDVFSLDYDTSKIRSEISSSIPENDKVIISLKTTIPLDKTKIDTNNLVNANEYTGTNPTLAIGLYRQEYNTGMNRWDSILIPQDVRDVAHYSEFQYSTLTEQGDIEVFPIQSYLSNNDGVSKHIPYWNNTNYRIHVDLNTLFGETTLYSDGTMEFVGEYSSDVDYIANDYVVFYDDPNVLVKPEWSAVIEYPVDSYVMYQGKLYKSLNTTINNNPATEVVNWKLVGNFYQCIADTSNWNSTRLYRTGDIVSYKASMYECLQDSIGNTPDAGVIFWSPIIPDVVVDKTIYDGQFWTIATKNTLVVEFIINEFSQAILNLRDNFSPYANNPIFKLNNFKWLTDIPAIFNNTTIFDYKFNPVKLNSDNVYVSEVDENKNEIVLKFDLSSKLQSLYMNQYIPDYIPYFSALEAEQEWNETLDVKTLIESKITLLEKSNLVNSFVKGIQSGISTIYGIFCRILGANYIFIIEKSPLAQYNNHVYRITSNLPRFYWDNYIKAVVHPLGWYEEYEFVSFGSGGDDPNVPEIPPIIPNDPYQLNKRNYYERLKSLILQLKSTATSYVHVNTTPPHNYDTRFYDLVAIEDMNSSAKFNWRVNTYEVPPNSYINPSLLTELDDPDKLKFKLTTFNDTTLKLHAEYRFTGVATEYVWTILKDGDVWQSFTSYSNIAKFIIPESWIGHTLEVRVDLLNDSIITNSNNGATFSHQVSKSTFLDSLDIWI